ncbi:MAG: hypothetical protein WB627_20080 [Candidatus Acidiferrum sp.]
MSLRGPILTIPQPSSRHDVLKGLGLGLGINALVFVGGLVLTLGGFPLVAWFLMTLGVTQFIYLGPLILDARRSQRSGRIKGLIIAASITLLLNAACGSAFWWPSSHTR